MVMEASATLNAAWQAASEEMYKATQVAEQQQQQGQQTGQANQSQSKGNDSEVTDVDFEEVKGDEKK